MVLARGRMGRLSGPWLSLDSILCVCCHRHPQMAAIPLDRLLLESDSPDGALELSPAWLEALPSLTHLPEQLQAAGLKPLNRPCVLRWTLQLVAAALGRGEEQVAAATCSNARRIFCGFNSSAGEGG